MQITYDVKKIRGGITIKMDADLAHDIVMLLDVLADLARVIRGKARAAEAEKKARSGKLKKKQAREFDRRSLEVMEKYMMLLDVTDDHQAARKEVKRLFSLPTLADVDICLMRARQITGKSRKDLLADRGEAENDILELNEAA